jgi:hypothetical protein
MDWLTFWSSVIKALAWPVVVFIFIFIFKNQLQSLFNFLEKVKYKDFELSFKHDIEEARLNAKELPRIEEVEAFKSLTENPVESVQQAWNELEQAMFEKLKELVPVDSPHRRRISLDGASDEMIFYGVFPPNIERVVQDLERLRSQLVHVTDSVISSEDARKYVILAKQVQRFVESLTELPAVKLTALTILILELNMLIDSGKYDDISIDEIYSHLESKTIFDFLKEKAGKDIDLSLFGDEGPYKGFKDFYLDWMENFYNCYGGDHRRKWGIENKGLCLLLAWTNEIIQQGGGWHPRS